MVFKRFFGISSKIIKESEMIYLEYLVIVAWHIFGKIVGLFYFFVAILFRKYSRNSMYNYILENKIYLKRLNERPISELGNHTFEGKEFYGYIIAPFHHTTKGGYIVYRKVSKLEFILNFIFIWSWLDDDANEDTFSAGHNQTYYSGERKFWFPLSWFKCPVAEYGNTFDLGDYRGDNSAFCFWGSFLWNVRNTFQNAKYLTYEVTEEEYNEKGCFYVEFKGYQFGWTPFDYEVESKRGRLCFIHV